MRGLGEEDGDLRAGKLRNGEVAWDAQSAFCQRRAECGMLLGCVVLDVDFAKPICRNLLERLSSEFIGVL